jgi:hypothetical protein
MTLNIKSWGAQASWPRWFHPLLKNHSYCLLFFVSREKRHILTVYTHARVDAYLTYPHTFTGLHARTNDLILVSNIGPILG